MSAERERQLKIDLRRRTRERVARAIGDTFALYEMAELERRDALMALADVLLNETAAVMAASEGSAQACGAVVAVLVQYQRGEINQQTLESCLARLGISMESERRRQHYA